LFTDALPAAVTGPVNGVDLGDAVLVGGGR
jgi:hypothetical protein